jgi:two-component system catabolic regulation response regulator CreB
MSAHILVVEDEPAIAESVAYALRRDGFTVGIAGNLAEAEAQRDQADLVVLDLMLPDGSGFDFIGTLRAMRPGKPVIVLSSRDGEADRVAALETGADDYVTKPFSPREIVARVRAVLRRVSGQGASPEAPDLPPIVLDRATRRAEVSVACMLDGPGRVYTRAELIDRVWGDGFAITDRTIDSHVKALRRKLGEAGGDAGIIETVRGVGYRVGLGDGPLEEP